MKLNELFNAIEQNKKKMESATAGATSSGNIIRLSLNLFCR